MPRKRDKNFDRSWPVDSTEIDEDKLIREIEEDETFHIGQVYEDVAATTLECAKCGSRQFNVGMGSYFTAIRCPNCGWELCIHG